MQIINPKNEAEWLALRMKDITSTDCAALFGISPYLTKFELFHRKKRAEVVDFKTNERVRWGNLLQDAIAAGVAEEQGWTVRKMTEYIRNEELRAGSSFDFSIENWIPTDPAHVHVKRQELGLLEIKNVDGLQYKNGWLEDEDGNIEAPTHIEIQVQHQLMVSEREFAYIGALVGGNNLILLKRTRDEVVIAAIRKAVAEFWASIEANEPPAPDFKADAAFISKLYGYAEPNKVFDARGDESVLEKALEYKRLGDIAKDADEKRKAIKAELLTIIGDSEKVSGEGFTISAGIVGSCPISYVREEYRNFRINWSKKK